MIWRQIRRSLKLTLTEGKQFIDRHLWLDPENPAVKQYFINLFTKTNNVTAIAILIDIKACK